MAPAVLEVDSIARRFGERRVLGGATLRVHAGEVVVLLGRNGCGKSTLMRIVAGELRADGGHVHILGRRIARPRLHRLAGAGVFYLPERGLLGPLATVGEHIDRLALRWRGDAAAAVELLGIEPLMHRFAAQLSGGERRRVEIAMALVRLPRLLLADEPLQGIAPRDAEPIVQAIRTLVARGCAILATGHEVRALLDLADSVVWMTGGTTHALGTPAAAQAHHSFRVDYLGPGSP